MVKVNFSSVDTRTRFLPSYSFALDNSLFSLVTEQGVTINEAVYWKYDNSLSRDGVQFYEFDHWIEFHSDGTFRHTVWVKWSPTGNFYGGGTAGGPAVHSIRTGRYRILKDTYDFPGELIYDDDPTMPSRLIIPQKFTRFWPPDGFDLVDDPYLENYGETNWKRTRAVGVRPPRWKNF